MKQIGLGGSLQERVGEQGRRIEMRVVMRVWRMPDEIRREVGQRSCREKGKWIAARSGKRGTEEGNREKHRRWNLSPGRCEANCMMDGTNLGIG